VKSGSLAGGASKRVLRSNSKDFLRFRGYVISDEFFICTRFAQKSPSRNSVGQACPLYRALSTVGRLCEKKKRRTRAKPPRPPEVIPSATQFLCVSAPLREEKIRRGGLAILRGRLQRRQELVRGGGSVVGVLDFKAT